MKFVDLHDLKLIESEYLAEFSGSLRRKVLVPTTQAKD